MVEPRFATDIIKALNEEGFIQIGPYYCNGPSSLLHNVKNTIHQGGYVLLDNLVPL